jgi:hypothetical protein
MGKVQCTSGCALESATKIEWTFGWPSQEYLASVYAIALNPAVLCAETPDAQTGDACTSSAEVSAAPACMPTRAQLDGNGGVASQSYLQCDGTGHCAPSSPPVISNYLKVCSVTPMNGVSGVMSTTQLPSLDACLVAWDDATQTMASGKTVQCAGDWACPAGSLCDRVPVVGTASAMLAVCKPGPRGTLTPAMLSTP